MKGDETVEEKKVDRRVRKTKRQLRQALTQLLQQKPIKDITVREIADLVDINRGTFYLHYKDIYDMLASIEQELSDKFIQIFQKYNARNTKDFPYPLFLDIFEFVSDNAELFRVLIGPNGDISFIMKIHQLYNMYCIQTEISKLSPELSINCKYYGNFILYGCVGLIEQWLSSDNPESPREMAKLVTKLVSTGVLSLIK